MQKVGRVFGFIFEGLLALVGDLACQNTAKTLRIHRKWKVVNRVFGLVCVGTEALLPIRSSVDFLA